MPTVEYKVELIAPAAGKRLIADAQVVKPGQTLLITRGEVHAERAGSRTRCPIVQRTLTAGRADR